MEEQIEEKIENLSIQEEKSKKKERYFKVYKPKLIEGTKNKYELLPHDDLNTKHKERTRYKGSTAYLAAKKVLKKMVSDNPVFVLQETTRNSNKKLYFYGGEKRKMAKPRECTLTNKKTGEVRKVMMTHETEPHALTQEDLGHPNPLSNWKPEKKHQPHKGMPDKEQCLQL